MTVVGVTGHQSLPVEARDYVLDALTLQIERLSQDSSIWGITNLAVGTDQMFARLVLDAGGTLHVIIPSRSYESTFQDEGLEQYQTLLAAARKVERLDFEEPSEEAFLAAGRRIVDSCDVLLAVWDGGPSRGLGGTADVVRYAEISRKPVEVIWPTGVTR